MDSMGKQKSAPAPAHLSASSREWFDKIVASWALESHHVLLLTGCCEALDRITEAREAVLRDGAYTRTRLGGVARHPALNVWRDSWITFARLLRELDLDIEPPKEASRPPALRSIRR